MSEPCCVNLRNYIIHLLSNYYRYFSKDTVLNSDGRRLLNELIREGMKCNPSLRKLFRKVRKNPTLSNIIRLSEEVLGTELTMELVRESIYYP